MPDPSSITAITPRPSHPQQAQVRVAGKIVATLSISQIEALGLAVGDPWDDATVLRVDEAATYEKALRQAMRWIDRRMLSKTQLDAKLQSQDYDQALRQRVVDRLVEIGAIDDAQLGRLLIEQTTRKIPAGPALLHAKLVQRGLDESLAQQLIDQFQNELPPGQRDNVDDDMPSPADTASNTTAAALALAQQKLPSLERFDIPTRQRRLWGVLARRGFDEQTILDVFEKLCYDQHE